jgi:hypothetical protein
MTPESSSPPLSNESASDHHEPYTWGRPPSTYLSCHQMVRLTILRSHLRERAADLNEQADPDRIQDVVP